MLEGDFASAGTAALRAHMKIHSGKKSFECNQCDYASVEKGNLRQHMKSHNHEDDGNYPIDGGGSCLLLLHCDFGDDQ